MRSTLTPLSCTSSTTTALYFVSHGSRSISCNSMPSVKNLIFILGEIDVSNRTEYPTLLAGDEEPSGVPISSATRLASEIAATRLGSVIAMHPPTVASTTFSGQVDEGTFTGFGRHQSSAMRNCGTCVLFPHPVSPTSNMTSSRLRCSRISSA